MPRDEWGYRSWGEQLVRGLLALLAVAIVARVVAEVLAPLIPVLVGALILVLIFSGILGRRRRW